MKLDRLTLEQLIQETLDESFMNPGGYGVPHPKQKKAIPTSSVEDAEKRFIDSVISPQAWKMLKKGLLNRYKALEYKEQKALQQNLTQVIDDAIEKALSNFTPSPIAEDREK